MGRYSKSPDLIDELKYISISKLKEWGYLQVGKYDRGLITWSRNGNKSGSIAISISTHFMYMELDYTYNMDIPVNYRVELRTKPSNLGKGLLWYFICPATGKGCKKLYQNGSKFLHRSTLIGYLYEKQTYSHNTRRLMKIFDGIEAREKIHGRYFKSYYNGKPTKRFSKLLIKANLSMDLSFEQLALL